MPKYPDFPNDEAVALISLLKATTALMAVNPSDALRAKLQEAQDIAIERLGDLAVAARESTQTPVATSQPDGEPSTPNTSSQPDSGAISANGETKPTDGIVS